MAQFSYYKKILGIFQLFEKGKTIFPDDLAAHTEAGGRLESACRSELNSPFPIAMTCTEQVPVLYQD